MMDKLDDMENRDKRNNIVFWNIPEKSEAGIGCKNLIYNILYYQLGLDDPRGFVIERAHRTQTEISPRPIHCCFLNWEDKEYILRIAPGRLKRNPLDETR